jgi:hypothetical protein
MKKCGVAFIVVAAATVASMAQARSCRVPSELRPRRTFFKPFPGIMFDLSFVHQEIDHDGGFGIASFFHDLTVGGVARPVDTLLMAGLIIYGAAPFEKAVNSKTRQLAFVFQVSSDFALASPANTGSSCNTYCSTSDCAGVS